MGIPDKSNSSLAADTCLMMPVCAEQSLPLPKTVNVPVGLPGSFSLDFLNRALSSTSSPYSAGLGLALALKSTEPAGEPALVRPRAFGNGATISSGAIPASRHEVINTEIG